MHHTDVAGVAFYANVFIIAHECYEHWLEQFLPLSDVFKSGDIHIPIVHAEADYRLPMYLSDEITVELALAEKRKTSFSLAYTFLNADGKRTAQAKTVHAVIDSQTRKPVKLTQVLQDALSSL